MNDRLRIAVMGTGAFGILHARTLAGLPEVHLSAVGNRTRAKAESVARELGVSGVFESIEELADRRLADAVVIATSSETHVSLAMQAIARGLHVLVEKPVGTTLVEVQQLADACSRSDRVAMAGHVCLFHSLVEPLLQRVRRHGFRSAHFVRHRPAATLDLFPHEHPITLTMVHDLAVATRLVDGVEPEQMEAWEAVGPRGADHAWAMLRWSDGRVATFHSHWILPPGAPEDGFDRTEVCGDSFHACVATNPQGFTWADDRLRWPVPLEISSVQGRPTGMLAEELRSFAAACRGGRVPDGCRIVDAIQVQRWMERLLDSARRPGRGRAGPSC